MWSFLVIYLRLNFETLFFFLNFLFNFGLLDVEMEIKNVLKNLGERRARNQ